MKLFGLTGGIATGKSTVSRLMMSMDERIVVFDADQSVHKLYAMKIVLKEVQQILGDQVLLTSGQLDKDYMRKVVFADFKKKKQLEEYIHPLVRKECLAMIEKASHSVATSFFVADVPLLFESGFDFGQEANLVVATSRKTQVSRLKMRSGLDDDTVNAILEAQLPISSKEKCADVVLWNEGPIIVLKKQIERFIKEQIS